MFDSYVLHLSSASPALAALATLVLVLMIGTSAQILADLMRLHATGPLPAAFAHVAQAADD